jgi:rare lipoprotein A
MILFTPVAAGEKDNVVLLWCMVVLIFLSLFFVSAVQASGHRPAATQKPYIINNKRYYPIPSAEGYSEKGVASWYGGKFHGRKTSNGEIYNMHDMTAAHKTLPMNTMLLVKNLANGRQTVVRINDRGPFVRGRIVDLSYKAAIALGIHKKGITRVHAIALGEEAINKWGEPPVLVYKDLSVGEFFVQIGAFSKKFNADRLQKRFTDAGHTTVIRQSNGAKSMFYSVLVYAGKTMQHARRAEKSLLEHGYVGAFIIAE